MSSEFEIIARYFQVRPPAGVLGVGDDCAVLPVPEGHDLATSTDMLLEGRHFLANADANALGHKALAVNLSDLAAMGARPAACLLALGLPNVDPNWLAAFSSGFHALAQAASCPLVGGDTTRSTAGVVITVTVMGWVPINQALRRDAAQVGDDIWITGELGAADIALRVQDGRLPYDADLLAATQSALDRPQPPWAFAQTLPGLAHAAIDISDGLAQDLGHVLAASQCGADLFYDRLPQHPALAQLDARVQEQAVLAGGDVYELCFTADPCQRDHLSQQADAAGVRLSRIGVVTQQPGLHLHYSSGKRVQIASQGFDHFADESYA